MPRELPLRQDLRVLTSTDTGKARTRIILESRVGGARTRRHQRGQKKRG